MSTPRDFSRAAWRLKLKRAEKHFEELNAKIADYLSGNPYRAVRRPQKGHRKRHVWTYVLEVGDKPDAELAIILGDVVHNLRSALDHLVVAIAPRKRRDNAGFPICDIDPWAKDSRAFWWPWRRYSRAQAEARKRFASQTRGVPDGALAVIKDLQPYRRRDAEHHPIRLLSRLENADKHKSLIPMLSGLSDVGTIMLRGGKIVGAEQWRRGWKVTGFSKDGAVIAEETFPPSDIPQESEVEVKITEAIPIFALRTGRDDVDTLLLWRVKRLLETFARDVFDDLEPFVRADYETF